MEGKLQTEHIIPVYIYVFLIVLDYIYGPKCYIYQAAMSSKI